MPFTPDPDDVALVVSANSFELVSPTTGDVVAELTEPAAGVAELSFGNPSGVSGGLQWPEMAAGGPVYLHGPEPAAGNPANITLTDGPYVGVFSGGGLGIPGAQLTLDTTTPTATLYVDDGAGIPTDQLTIEPGSLSMTTPAVNVNGRQARFLFGEGDVAASAGLVPVPAVRTDVPGCSWSLDLIAGDVVHVWPVFDFIRTAAGGLVVGEVWVDDGGGRVYLPKQAVFGNTAQRGDASQAMRYVALVTATHTMGLTAVVTGAGAYNCNVQHTGALYQHWGT